jgi:hypothetical protein
VLSTAVEETLYRENYCAANDAMLLDTVTCDTSIDSILRFPSDMIGSPSGDEGD